MRPGAIILAAVAGTWLATGGIVAAQDGPVPPAGAPGSLTIPDTALLAGAIAAPDCGDLYSLAGRAFCVTAPLAAIGDLAAAYVAHFEGLGWLAAGGDDNRVVMIKRQDGGGCNGLQLLAFYDERRPAAPGTPGYIAMATIPGDVCAAVTQGPATPAAAPQDPQ